MHMFFHRSVAQEAAEWFTPGQTIGPQNPGQQSPVPLPYTNEGGNLGKNHPEAVKKGSAHLMYPLQQVLRPYLFSLIKSGPETPTHTPLFRCVDKSACTRADTQGYVEYELCRRWPTWRRSIFRPTLSWC